MSVEERQQPTQSKPFVIGGVGHRLLPQEHSGLEGAIHRALAWILAEHADDPEPPRLLVSVAEGADRLIIDVAHMLGMRYTCVLPCSADCFEDDFGSARSIEAYRRMLSQADAVVQPREDPADRLIGYLWTNDYILDRCDVLVAVWDGNAREAPAGTGDTVQRAIERAIPVLWIPTEPPHEPERLHAFALGRG